MFRVERLGDTNHLTNGGEKISSSGYFTELLQEIKK
jgi:probable phosphoglycerate mutase